MILAHSSTVYRASCASCQLRAIELEWVAYARAAATLPTLQPTFPHNECVAVAEVHLLPRGSRG
jgi:hypothetical protein